MIRLSDSVSVQLREKNIPDRKKKGSLNYMGVDIGKGYTRIMSHSASRRSHSINQVHLITVIFSNKR
jgi:hypothetical protein